VGQWADFLSQFPVGLQREICDERSGGNESDWREVKDWVLRDPAPVVVPLTRHFVAHHDWLIAMLLPEAREQINERYALVIKQGEIYDLDPERVLRYAKLPGETADPSVMVEGQIYFGCGRFVAAMLRGDESLRVWCVVSR